MKIKKLEFPLPSSNMTIIERDVMYHNYLVDLTEKINEIIDLLDEKL